MNKTLLIILMVAWLIIFAPIIIWLWIECITDISDDLKEHRKGRCFKSYANHEEIEAIPMEWIERWLNNNNPNDGEQVINMIDDWRKNNEMDTDKRKTA